MLSLSFLRFGSMTNLSRNSARFPDRTDFSLFLLAVTILAQSRRLFFRFKGVALPTSGLHHSEYSIKAVE